MGRKKRKSSAMDKARKRLAGVKSIDPLLDLGNGLSAAEYDAKIETLEDALEVYNEVLSTADEKLNEVEREEDELNELSDRMLKGVGAAFGTDSNEYEMAGGTRKSEKKPPTQDSSDDEPAPSTP